MWWRRRDVEVRLATEIIPKRESFKYLGVRNPGSGDIDEDLGPALLYGASVGGQERSCPKMHVAEMRMLRWMCGHTRSDRIRSEVIRRRWEWPRWWTRRGKRGEMVWTCEKAGVSPVRVRGWL
ncbi:hypothetical protein H5410_057192 [Solanum commersonii]|uniref:Uncharacterized protein n=1 Tax=Solanum commersonii TaxID=4109 RepID=A0A9J5WND7_SOLCO|nr:hypothetical protein H5410_057192 [Solanum commersonii]